MSSSARTTGLAFFLGIAASCVLYWCSAPARAQAGMSAADKLLAIEEIKQLKARYFRYVDTKDWEGYKSVFAPDITFTWGERNEVRHGPEGKLQLIRDTGLYDRMRSVHHGFMPEIEILSPTTAKGIWAMEDLVWYPAGLEPKSKTELLKPGESMHGYGHYYETYTKINGHWLIQSQDLKRLRVDKSETTIFK